MQCTRDAEPGADGGQRGQQEETHDVTQQVALVFMLARLQQPLCKQSSKKMSFYCAEPEEFFCWFFSCDQAALWMVQSVRLSVTPFWLCSHHRIIMKFLGVITSDKSDVHAKGQGQRSKVKVTTQLHRFRTVTPVWIHIWWWNHAYGLMILRRGALLFFKVICQISRSHGSKKRRIWPRLGVSGL